MTLSASPPTPSTTPAAASWGLARKWRPQTFQDLVGQEHVSRVLANAIRLQRVGHSYLFTGTRGVGKTSSARIFAKTLRCPHPPQPAVPCNQCRDCIEITEGRSLDVLEIDGASNNGVDAIRELRDNAKFLPTSGQYKIYIIDEVHMLTTAAFNALLKTLEEPPEHLVFLFATTDPQKIPATVLSRTQRFDFKRVSLAALVQRLTYIAEQEGLEMEPDALSLIAREAEGSLRDAISLLDQASSLGFRPLSAAQLAETLGLVDKSLVLGILEGILKGQVSTALDSLGRFFLHGGDLRSLGRELLRQLRSLMVIQALELKGLQSPQTALLLDLPDGDFVDLKKWVRLRTNDELDVLFLLLSRGLDDAIKSPVPRMMMDVLLIKLCSASELMRYADLTSAPLQSPRHPDTLTQPLETPQSHKPPVQAGAPTTTAVPAAIPQRPPSLPPSPQPPSSATPLNPMAFSWQKFVEMVRSQKPLLGAILEHATFEGFRIDSFQKVGLLSIGLSKKQSLYREQLQSKAYFDGLVQMAQAYVKGPVRVEFVETAATRSLEELQREKALEDLKRKQQIVLQSEAVRAAQEVLGAKLEKLDIL